MTDREAIRDGDEVELRVPDGPVLANGGQFSTAYRGTLRLVKPAPSVEAAPVSPAESEHRAAHMGDTLRITRPHWALGPVGTEFVAARVDSDGFAWEGRMAYGVAMRDYEIVRPYAPAHLSTTPGPSAAVTLWRDPPSSVDCERWRSYKVDEYQAEFRALPASAFTALTTRAAEVERVLADLDHASSAFLATVDGTQAVKDGVLIYRGDMDAIEAARKAVVFASDAARSALRASLKGA